MQCISRPRHVSCNRLAAYVLLPFCTPLFSLVIGSHGLATVPGLIAGVSSNFYIVRGVDGCADFGLIATIQNYSSLSGDIQGYTG